MKKTAKKIKEKVYEYTAIFDRNELDGYTVTVPALPGLVTEGRTLKEARSMAEDAIRCYIEGLHKAKETVPKERDLTPLKVTVKM